VHDEVNQEEIEQDEVNETKKGDDSTKSCKIPRIRTYSSSRSSQVIYRGANRKRMQLNISH